MNFQLNYWLYPLIAIGVFGIFFRLRTPLAFSWAPILQSTIILATAICGLRLEPKLLFIFVGWGFTLLISFNSRAFYSGLQGSINSLNSSKLHELSRKAKHIFWGKAGDFWQDMTEALALYIEYKEVEADALILKWQVQTDSLPKEISHLSGNYKLIGNALMRKWENIIDIYENKLTNTPQANIPSILLPTARAYAEMGEFEKAYECIKKAKLDESSYPLSYIGQSLLPFFALIGARIETEKLLDILDKDKNTFPESLVCYWRGQSLLTTGNTDGAIRLFEDAKTKNPSREFVERIEKQIEKARKREGEILSFHPRKDVFVRDVWTIFEKADFVLAVISPQKKSMVVIAIMLVNTLIYLYSDAYNFPGIKENAPVIFENLVKNCDYVIHTFALIPKLAMDGQYYRFFTYLFLHLYFMHYVLNMFMLYFFGRMAENIFGTARFLAIYCVGGILSGVAQAVLSPGLIAVGASGALMACFGAVLAGIYKLKNRLPRPIWTYHLSVLMGLALTQIGVDQILPGIASFAHLGGLLAGMAFGLVIPPVPPRTVPEIEPGPELLAAATPDESEQSQ